MAPACTISHVFRSARKDCLHINGAHRSESERASDSPTELILVEAAGLGHVPFFERLPYPVLPLQLLEKGLMLLDRLLHVHGGRGCARVGVRAVRVSAGAMRAHCAVCVRARSGA